jgi:hypothetical protein
MHIFFSVTGKFFIPPLAAYEKKSKLKMLMMCTHMHKCVQVYIYINKDMNQWLLLILFSINLQRTFNLSLVSLFIKSVSVKNVLPQQWLRYTYHFFLPMHGVLRSIFLKCFFH